MIDWIKKPELKIFLIAWIANFIENIVLLYFFNVPFTKSVWIGSSVFALAVVLLYKLFERIEW